MATPETKPWKMYIAEFIGTFILVFVILIILEKMKSNKILIPILIGLTVAIAIYVAEAAGGLGAVNPVVSYSLYRKGSISSTDLAGHIAAQLVAALLAIEAAILLKDRL